LDTMLEQLSSGDKLIVRRLSELADTVSELRSLMATLREIGTVLESLNPVNAGVLSDEGYHMLSFIEELITEKEKIALAKQSRPGRPVQPYPSNFLDVYKRYRSKEFNGLVAAKMLSVNYDKFRELVKIFEVKILGFKEDDGGDAYF